MINGRSLSAQKQRGWRRKRGWVERVTVRVHHDRVRGELDRAERLAELARGLQNELEQLFMEFNLR